MQIIAILLGLFIISSMVIADQKWGKIDDEDWKLEAPRDYPEANAVVIFDKGELEVGMSRIIFDRHVRIKILNQAGIEEVGNVDIDYYIDDKLRSIKAQTVSPDGKKYKVDKKAILEKTVDDYITKTIAFPNLEPGCIIEYTYSYSNDRFGYITPWHFQSDIYTLYSEFKLHLYPGLIFNAVTSNLASDEKEPETSFQLDLNNPQGQKHQIDVWRVYNRPPIKDEPYMSFRENYIASLCIELIEVATPDYKRSFATTWADIGERWQKWINVDYLNKHGFVKDLAESLTDGMTDKDLMVRTLYDYVKDNYKTDDQGSKFFNNDKLSQMLDKKTGTAKEKNVFLTELIKALDIPSWNIMIGTRNKRVFDPTIIQDHQFNHIITLAEIDRQYIYMDTETKYCPYGNLPVESRSNGGLRVDGKNSDLVKLVYENPDSYRRDLTKMFITKEGAAICTTTVKCSGYQASDYGELYESKTVEDFVKKYFLDKIDVAYTYDDPAFTYDSTGIFTMKLTYRLDNYVREIENNYFVKPIQFNYRANPFKNEKRFFPVDFGYPCAYYNTVEIRCEDSIISQTLPEKTNLEFPGSSFEKGYTVLGQGVVCEMQYDRKIPIVLEKGYSNLREFFINMAETVNDEIVFTKSVSE